MQKHGLRRVNTQTPMRVEELEGNKSRYVPKHANALIHYNGVKSFKSIWRAIRRGHVSKFGTIYPSRPFNNRKRTIGRKQQLDFEKNLTAINNYRKCQLTSKI